MHGLLNRKRVKQFALEAAKSRAHEGQFSPDFIWAMKTRKRKELEQYAALS